jgi:hypothetical protein
MMSNDHFPEWLSRVHPMKSGSLPQAATVLLRLERYRCGLCRFDMHPGPSGRPI